MIITISELADTADLERKNTGTRKYGMQLLLFANAVMLLKKIGIAFVRKSLTY